jgi:hypothetical protein
MDNFQPPLVSGPEPNLLARMLAAWRDVRSAVRVQQRSGWSAVFRRSSSLEEVVKADSSRSTSEGEGPPSPSRSAPESRRGKADRSSPRTAAEPGAALWERLVAFLFISAWTIFLIFPVAADYLGDPRAAIDQVVAAWPLAGSLELYARAALWQSPPVAACTFVLRLYALTITRINGLNAGGTFVIAMLIDGASWFIWGRAHLAASGLSAQEQAAAGHLMIVFAVSSLAIWGLFGPPSRRRVGAGVR